MWSKSADYVSFFQHDLREAGMLMRPAGHEAEVRKSEDKAEAQIFFRGRGHGHNVWGRGQTR